MTEADRLFNINRRDMPDTIPEEYIKQCQEFEARQKAQVNTTTVSYSGDRLYFYGPDVPGGYAVLPDTDPLARYMIGCLNHVIAHIPMSDAASAAGGIGNLDASPKQGFNEFGCKENYPGAFRQRG